MSAASPARRASAIASCRSGATPRRRTAAPASRAWAATVGPLLLRICPGAGVAETSTISSPVTRSATTGRRATRTRARPAEASTAIAAGSITRPARENDVPRPDLGAAGRHVRALRDRRQDGHPELVERLRLLDLLDGVGAGRNRRPGHDAYRLARADREFGPLPGPHLADDLEGHRSARHVRRPQRVAVHGRAVEERQVGIGSDVPGEHAGERGVERHLLERERGRLAQDDLERLLDGNHEAYLDCLVFLAGLPGRGGRANWRSICSRETPPLAS